MISKETCLILLNKAFKRKGGGITPTGEISITSNGEYDVTEYATANVNVPSLNNAKVIATIPSGVSSVTNTIQELPTYDCTNITNLGYFMRNYQNLEKIGGFTNTGSVTQIASLFENCKKLKSIPSFDTSNVTTFASAFRGCTILEDIPILDTSSVTNMAYTFYESPALTDESLNNIMAMCINSALTSGKTLDSIGLSSAQRTRCQSLSNYSALISAGWTG